MKIQNGFAGGAKVLALAGLCALVVSTPQAKASVVIVFNPVASSGSTFVYDFNFTSATDTGTGMPTDILENASGSVNGQPNVRGFGTVYDLPGVVSITLNSADAALLALSQQATGITPVDVTPTDGPLINFTLSYIGAQTSTNLILPGAVTVVDTNAGLNINGFFTGQDAKGAGDSAGTEIGNVGHTTIPTGTPEPASLFTFAGGAAALFFGTLGRRFRK